MKFPLPILLIVDPASTIKARVAEATPGNTVDVSGIVTEAPKLGEIEANI
jgi:hypothetical protein